jgi:hypothetical protein
VTMDTVVGLLFSKLQYKVLNWPGTIITLQPFGYRTYQQSLGLFIAVHYTYENGPSLFDMGKVF